MNDCTIETRVFCRVIQNWFDELRVLSMNLHHASKKIILISRISQNILMISSCAVVHLLFVFFSKEVVPCKFLKDLCLQDNLTMLSQPTLNEDEWRNTSTQTIYLRDTSTQVLPNDYREDHHPTDEEALATRCPKIKNQCCQL